MEFEMEFEGFAFNANSFISVPGLNEKKEVLAVLKHCPETVVGANKPFIQKQKRQLKRLQKELNDENKIIINENMKNTLQQSMENELSNLQIVFDVEDASYEQKEEYPLIKIQRGIKEKKWFFIGGDLYLNLDVFTNEGKKKKEMYSHWNEWRPHSTLESFQNYIQLNMRTDNEAPFEFNYIIDYLQNMQINQAFQVSKMLQQYSLFVKNEFQSCNKIRSYCEDHFESLQELLAENYNNSLKKAHKIIEQIGQEYPFIYFIRKNNYRSLRMQVSAIGFNYVLTEILCENRDNYVQTLHHNGFSEIFSNYTHYQLLMMNLLQQNEAEIEIVTVDDILVPCKVKAYSYDLTTYTLTQETSFTNSLRIYKFEIDDMQLKRIAKIRKERPLNFLENDKDFQYNFTCDEFLRQYYHYFAYQRNSKSNYQNTKQQLTNSIDDKQSILSNQKNSLDQKNLQVTSSSQDINSLQELNGIETQIMLASQQNENKKEQNQLNILNINQFSNIQTSPTKNISQLGETSNQISLQETLKKQYPLNLTQFENNNLAFLNNSNNIQQINTSNQQQINIQNINHNILNNNIPNLLNNQNTQYNIYNYPNINPNQFLQSQEQAIQQLNANQINQLTNNSLSLTSITPQINSNQMLSQNIENNTFNQLVYSPIKYGVDINQIEQQQQYINILNDCLQLQQKKIIYEQQELEQLQDLMTKLLNEQTTNFQLYVQLKQILLNYNLNGQIAPLNTLQLQFIQQYEQNLQYVELIQNKINSISQK